MNMKKIKFKILILLVFAMTKIQYPLYIFDETHNENLQVNKNESTILDGEIGEWDLELDDKPNFSDENLDEIEGRIPNEDDYYTISVTVPVNMEFYVLPNSQLAFGSFYSPMYTIKNNGSKNISVSLDSFQIKDKIEDDDTTPLYVEKINSQDNKTQIELKLCAIDDLSTKNISKHIDLTQIDTLLGKDKELYVLSQNEKKGIIFDAEKWELPQYASNKKQAMSNFSAGFVFSVIR